jgi:hypothetical protein
MPHEDKGIRGLDDKDLSDEALVLIIITRYRLNESGKTLIIDPRVMKTKDQGFLAIRVVSFRNRGIDFTA